MAVEDGKMMEFTPEMIAGFIKSRHETFAAMIEQSLSMDYEMVGRRLCR